MSLEPNKDAAKWTLRGGLALTLLVSIVKKFLATDTVTNKVMANLVGSWVTPASTIIIGVLLLVAGVMVVTGWQERVAAGFLSLFFLVTIIAGLVRGGPLFTVGPAIWKDFALLGASLALFYYE